MGATANASRSGKTGIDAAPAQTLSLAPCSCPGGEILLDCIPSVNGKAQPNFSQSNGVVLVVGGFGAPSSAELYGPATKVWSYRATRGSQPIIPPLLSCLTDECSSPAFT